MLFPRNLLWIDCGAAFASGLVMLSLAEWLSRLYDLPHGLLLAMGLTSLSYGAFSFSLASRARRQRSLLTLLVAANAVWAALCWMAAVWFANSASAFGLVHLIGEGLIVGALAALEWRHRELLSTAN